MFVQGLNNMIQDTFFQIEISYDLILHIFSHSSNHIEFHKQHSSPAIDPTD